MYIIRLTMKKDVLPSKQTILHSCAAPTAKVRERVDVLTLMAGRRDVVLVHGAEEYLLRITSLGKLILTK
jgi:hemin uptake protein HemP